MYDRGVGGGGGNKTSEIIGPKTYTSLTLQQLQQHKKGQT